MIKRKRADLHAAQASRPQMTSASNGFQLVKIIKEALSPVQETIEKLTLVNEYLEAHRIEQAPRDLIEIVAKNNVANKLIYDIRQLKDYFVDFRRIQIEFPPAPDDPSDFNDRWLAGLREANDVGLATLDLLKDNKAHYRIIVNYYTVLSKLEALVISLAELPLPHINRTAADLAVDILFLKDVAADLQSEMEDMQRSHLDSQLRFLLDYFKDVSRLIKIQQPKLFSLKRTLSTQKDETKQKLVLTQERILRTMGALAKLRNDIESNEDAASKIDEINDQIERWELWLETFNPGNVSTQEELDAYIARTDHQRRTCPQGYSIEECSAPGHAQWRTWYYQELQRLLDRQAAAKLEGNRMRQRIVSEVQERVRHLYRSKVAEEDRFAVWKNAVESEPAMQRALEAEKAANALVVADLEKISRELVSIEAALTAIATAISIAESAVTRFTIKDGEFDLSRARIA